MNLSKLWEIVRTGKPEVLQSMGLQSVGHDLLTEQRQQKFLHQEKKSCTTFQKNNFCRGKEILKQLYEITSFEVLYKTVLSMTRNLPLNNSEESEWFVTQVFI